MGEEREWPPGWYAYHPADSTLFHIGWWDGRRWTGETAVRHVDGDKVDAILAHEDLIRRLGPAFGDLANDADAVIGAEVKDAQASGAGYRATPLIDAAKPAAERLVAFGREWAATHGEESIDELMTLLRAVFPSSWAAFVEPLLRGESWRLA